MGWILIIILGFIVVFFFLINPAEKAIVHENLEEISDQYLDQEYGKTMRWVSHYVSAGNRFKERANSSGAYDKYIEYKKKIEKEKARRALARKLVNSVPELKMVEEISYRQILSDGILKIAFEMKESGKSEYEIIDWFVREVNGGGDDFSDIEEVEGNERLPQADRYVRPDLPARRSLNDVMQEFCIGAAEISGIANGYKFSLQMTGDLVEFSQELNDLVKDEGILSEEEMEASLISHEQAIVNRIIVRLVKERYRQS
ncbi:hypothetical protein ACLD02_02975 [Alloalcanivorax sp. C16-2]|uniref:hypothetical protein n=1 Tax=Alloalcanivorax sp. C16-2 TaxID=3390052 RepID=UPI003970942A